MEYLKKVDIANHIELALNSLLGELDPTNNHLPYWAIGFKNGQLSPFPEHWNFDYCHGVSRAIHALNMIEESVGKRVEENIWRDLAELEIALFDKKDGLPGTKDENDKYFVQLHNIRESVHALTALIRRGDERASICSRKMIRTILSALDEHGSIHLERLPSYVRGYTQQPREEGRAVDALVRSYRTTEDEAALELANRIVSYALEHCFTPMGRIKEEAGTHGHSINAMIAGMLDFALLSNNRELLERVKQIYDVGCPRFNSSFGWSMESLNKYTQRGESNNTGDLLRCALLLGGAGWPKYFEDAERILRGHLLPSQVIKVDDLPDEVNEDDDRYSRRASRLRGGFSFPTPNDYLLNENAAIATYDITSGAVDAMCEVMKSIITSDEVIIRINLLLSHKAKKVSITSYLSKEGRLDIENKSGHNLLVRIPSWVDKKDVLLKVNGIKQHNIFLAAYLLIPAHNNPLSSTVTFPLRKVRTTESISFLNYTIDWQGDQIIAMSPPAKYRPMFPACE